jgi:hypothetical protein
MNIELTSDEKSIDGVLHYRTVVNSWRPYQGEALERRVRELMDDSREAFERRVRELVDDNPAPSFSGDNDDK